MKSTPFSFCTIGVHVYQEFIYIFSQRILEVKVYRFLENTGYTAVKGTAVLLFAKDI